MKVFSEKDSDSTSVLNILKEVSYYKSKPECFDYYYIHHYFSLDFIISKVKEYPLSYIYWYNAATCIP